MGKPTRDDAESFAALARVVDRVLAEAEEKRAEQEKLRHEREMRRQLGLVTVKVKHPFPGRPRGSKDTKPRKRRVPPVALSVDTARDHFYYVPETGHIRHMHSRGHDIKDCRHPIKSWDYKDPEKRDNNFMMVRFRHQEHAAHDVAYMCMGLEPPSSPPTYRNGDKYDTSWENIKP